MTATLFYPHALPERLQSAVPASVERLITAGDRRGAAEELARLDLDGQVHEHAVEAALERIAAHLPPEDRADIYGEDLLPWLDEARYADETGAPRARVGDADPDAQVQRCLDELTGVS